MATVTFEKAAHIYPGNDRPLVDQFDLKIEDGESLVLVGPSGYGKSTSLRMLTGSEDANEGHIFIDDKDVTGVPPKNRDITMIFQNYTPYPHMAMRENMGFILKIVGTPKGEITKCVEEATRILDLEPYLDRRPEALPGGQRQRAAMGRTIIREPQVFLMDKSLSSLDAKLRVQTHTQITFLQRQFGVTTIYVTHNQTEALTMDDHIAVLEDGPLQQVGSPQEMCERLADEFVAGFIGSPMMNLDKFEVESSTMILDSACIPLSAAAVNTLTAEDKGMVTIGFRPEDLEFVSEAETNSIPTRVDFVEELGSDAFVYGHLAGTDGQGISSAEESSLEQLIVHVPPHTVPACGGVAYTRIITGQQHSFSASTDMRLPG